MATPKTPNQATNEKSSNRHVVDVRQNGDSTRDRYCFQHYWTKLYVFDVFKFVAFCLISVLFMHYIELFHASHVLIFESTQSFRLGGGLTACLMT